MELKEIIKKRRAYRSLEKVEITKELISDISETVSLSPSCFNYQPWRFVFVYGKDNLEKFKPVFNKGNEWAYAASMVVAVFSQKEKDCIIPDGREYYLFDTGMGTAFMILRGTELGLVFHPIAGYNEEMAKEILDIPKDAKLITLVVVGKKK